MTITARDALDQLLSQNLRRLDDMPDAIGLYGLGDHKGKLHYFGRTDSNSFRDRIWNRHITGSEGNSHKLACNYSVGRLWHDPKHSSTKVADGKIARRVRQALIRKYCGFVCLSLEMTKSELHLLEKGVIELARPHIADWNGTRKRVSTFEEPTELVDEIIRDLELNASQIEALERQRAIYCRL